MLFKPHNGQNYASTRLSSKKMGCFGFRGNGSVVLGHIPVS